jgi:hypothetical protein
VAEAAERIEDIQGQIDERISNQEISALRRAGGFRRQGRCAEIRSGASRAL